MKVVLFCGGLGTRLREFSETIPKSLVNVGIRPIVWHLMKYYAHYGHKEFILCLGYKGDVIKDYFLNYKETVSNNFVLKNGGQEIELLNTDLSEWKITFIDTGLKSNIGQRLAAVKEYVGDDEYFLANYSDGLTDLNLGKHIEYAKNKKSIATFIEVRPSQSFHTVHSDNEGCVERIEHVSHADLWINGGFFVLHKDIFHYMQEGEDLVDQPFDRLIQERRLFSTRYGKFWASMDTFKDKSQLDKLYESGKAPWMVWMYDQSEN